MNADELTRRIDALIRLYHAEKEYDSLLANVQKELEKLLA